MALPEGHKTNFETLKKAFEAGRAALVESKDSAGKPCAIICAVNPDGQGGGELVPLARMFDDNPYNEIADPFETMEKDKKDEQITPAG